MPGSEKEVCDKVGKHLYKEDGIPHSKFWNEFNDYKTRQRENPSSSVAQLKMTLPGRIVQMVRTSERLSNNPCCCVLSCVKCAACCGMSMDTKKYKVKWSVSRWYLQPFFDSSCAHWRLVISVASGQGGSFRNIHISVNAGGPFSIQCCSCVGVCRKILRCTVKSRKRCDLWNLETEEAQTLDRMAALVEVESKTTCI